MKRLIIYTILILSIGLTPAWIQYNGFMLTSDFLNQQIPFIIETKRMFASGIPFWSWNTYFGDNFIAAYSFYTLTSPFVWINSLFPLDYIYESITFTLYLKFICLALFSYIYLRKINISEMNAFIGSLLFCFSSYSIINIGYYHFMEPMMLFPLFLWSIEKFILKEHYSRTILSFISFCIFFSNFYFAPCTLISGGIYFLFRNGMHTQKQFRHIISALMFVSLGGLLSAVILFPTIFHIIGGPRTEISPSQLWDNKHFIWRLCSLFFPTLKEGVIPLLGFGTWGSNNTNIPVIGLLFCSLYIFKNPLSWISKTIYVLLLIYLSPLNGIFTLYTNPEYTRWSYALTFIIIIGSTRYLDSKRMIKTREYIIYLYLCLCLCLYRYFTPISWRIYKHIPFKNDEIPFTTMFIGLLLISLLLLYIYIKKQTHKRLTIVISIFSIIHLASFLFTRSDEYSKIFYGDKIKIGIFETYVMNNDLYYNQVTPPYRTQFITRQEPYYSNISLLKNTPSVSTYNSVQNNKVRKLFLCTDSVNNIVRNSFQPNINLTSFNSLMAVKEIIKYNDPQSTMPIPQLGELLEFNQNYQRFENPYYIPFGFTYDKYIEQTSIDSLLISTDKPDIPLIMLNALSIQDVDQDIMCKYLKKTTVKNCTLSLYLAQEERKKETCTNLQFNTKGFTCQSNLMHDNIIFFSVPADKGFKATVDNQVTKIYEVNCGLSAIAVPKGKHKIEFTFIPQGFYIGILISFIALLLFMYIYYQEYIHKQNHIKRCISEYDF